MGKTRATADPDRQPDLDQIFGALSDPTRRQIIVRLTRGEATLSELAQPFDLTMPGLSKHVTVLERAGIVHKWRSGRSHYCRLRPERLTAADEWLQSQTRFWKDRLEGLAGFLDGEDGGVGGVGQPGGGDAVDVENRPDTDEQPGGDQAGGDRS